MPYPHHILPPRELLKQQAVRQKYQLLITNSFVQDHPNLCWCPSPGCTNAILAPSMSSTDLTPVTCLCGHSFWLVCVCVCLCVCVCVCVLCVCYVCIHYLHVCVYVCVCFVGITAIYLHSKTALHVSLLPHSLSTHLLLPLLLSFRCGREPHAPIQCSVSSVQTHSMAVTQLPSAVLEEMAKEV